MNIAFWIIVIAIVVLCWFLAAPSFKSTGQYWYGLFSRAKREMTDENSDHNINESEIKK